MKTFNAYFAILLLISTISIDFAAATVLSGSRVRAGQLGGFCMKGMADSMPPNFCWKKGLDIGTFPTGCPDGYFRSLALCLENCKPGFSWDGLFLCKKDCPRGYATHPLTCFKHVFSWYVRDVYFQHSITNFSSSVPCPEGKYKGGALCYKNCNVIGMENCGIAACSTSAGECASAIITMVVDVVSGLADLVLFVVSLGTSTALIAAKNAVKNGLKKIGKSAIRRAVKSAVRSVKGKFSKVFIKKAITKVQKNIKELVKDAAKDGISNTLIYTFCNEVYSEANSSVKEPNYIDTNTIVSSVDFLNIKNISAACSGDQSDGGIMCAKHIMIGASNFDPTGLLTIGAAFLYESCDVPTRLPEPIVDQNELARYKNKSRGAAGNPEKLPVNGTVASGCVQLFEHINYAGKSATYCDDNSWIGAGHNDIWSSAKLGPGTSTVFYEDINYGGASFYTEQLNLPRLGRFRWDNRISSLKVAKSSDRVAIFEHSHFKGKVWFYRKGQENRWVGNDQNDIYSSFKVGSNCKLEVYRDWHFTGARHTFTRNVSTLSSFWNDQVSSFKVLSK